MKKILLFIQILITVNVYPAVISLDYSPTSVLITNKKDNGSINVENKVGPFDKMGDIYFSRISFSLYTNPIKFDPPENKTDYLMVLWGPFITLMHDNVNLEPVDIKYFEDGGKAHIVTGVLGLSLKALMSYGFFTELGLGFTSTSIFKDDFDRRSTGKDTDYTFKLGIGYCIKAVKIPSFNLGVDIILPVNSYHKMNDSSYSRLKHGGIYPYIGISF